MKSTVCQWPGMEMEMKLWKEMQDQRCNDKCSRESITLTLPLAFKATLCIWRGSNSRMCIIPRQMGLMAEGPEASLRSVEKTRQKGKELGFNGAVYGLSTVTARQVVTTGLACV